MSSWYRQRIEAGRHADPKTRGSRLIFRKVSDVDFSTMSEHQRCAVLLNIARSLASIEGLPETSIRLAEDESIGTAAATFLDAPDSFNKPAVILDRRFFKPDVEPDVFVGLVLHEMAHLLFTREFYRVAGKTSKQKKLLLNLIEDYRIERLMSESSAAWQTYLERTRRRLVEEDSLEEGVAQWGRLTDYDRVLLLIALFLFTPEVLESRQDLRAWKLRDGVCVFEELEEIFQFEPLAESQVFEAVKEIYLRFEVFKEADQVPTKEWLEILRDSNSKLDGEQGQRLGDGEKKPLWSGRRLADLILKRSEVGESFSSILIKMIEAEASETGLLEPPPLPFVPEDDSGSRLRVKVEFTEIQATDRAREIYNKAACSTRAVSEELNKIFADPTLGRGRSFLGQPAGRLDGRRLHRYTFDSRVFTEERQSKKKLTPTKIVLLLDGSGSMVGVPEQVALLLGVILCEAFRQSSNVDLRVFSHTALEYKVTICDYGDKQTVLGRLGAFSAQTLSNYDDVAMHEVAKLFDQDAGKRRVMFVLSDARPYATEGVGRSRGKTAVKMTARMVEQLRSEGWRVIGITTGPGYGAMIYGEDRVHLDKPHLIPKKFSKLLLDLFGTD
jgi:hypothetical protein